MRMKLICLLINMFTVIRRNWKVIADVNLFLTLIIKKVQFYNDQIKQLSTCSIKETTAILIHLNFIILLYIRNIVIFPMLPYL